MPTSTRSKGYKKKPTSEPANNNRPAPPTVSEQREHAGKTPASVGPPPSAGKRRQHEGKSRGPAKAKEKKEFRELRNINIYQGSTEPKTQRQKQLAARGKAVRKTLRQPKGHIPYQNIKNTGLIREGQLQLLKETVSKINKEIRTNKLDPKTRKEKHAEATALKAEVHRLVGRKKLGELHLASVEKNITVGPTLYPPKLTGKKAKRQYAKAKKEFRKFDHLQKEAVRMSEEAIPMPRASGPVTRKAINKIRTGAGNPFYVEPLQGVTLIGEEHHGKGDLFYVPRQEIPGTAGHDLLGATEFEGGNYYTRDEIRALTTLAKQAASEPSDFSVLVTAASLAPFAPEGKLLQLAGKGIQAFKTAGQAVEVASDVSSVSTAVSKVAEPALKQTAEGKVEFNVASKLADDGAVKLDRQLTLQGEQLPREVQQQLVQKADSPLNKVIETHAEDPRVMAGSGAPQDVNEAMWQAAARDARKYARSTITGVRLKAVRGVKFAGVGAATLGPVAVVSQDFREAAYRDVHDLIVGFVPSSVQFLTASGDALLNGLTLGQAGSNAPLDSIWKQMQKTDPFVLALQGKFSQAEAAFAERPISGLIEAGGVYAGVGKALGTVAREGLPGDLVSLKGGNVQHITGNFYKISDKSSNLFTQGIESLRQKLVSSGIDTDKVKIVTGKDGKQTIQYGSKAEALRAKAAGQKQLISFEKMIDERQSVFLIHSRQSMKEVEQEISHIVTGVSHRVTGHKHAGSALTAISSKIIRSPETATKDLKAWKEHLETNIASRAPNEDKSLLIENLSIVNTLIKHQDKLFKDDRLWKAAEEYRKSEQGRQEELVAMNAVEKEATEYAPWIPYAVHHMDAHFNTDTKQFELNDRKLELDDIKAHAAEHGVVGEPAMITTRVIDGGQAGEFEQNVLPSLDNYHSAGKAIESGNFDLAARSMIRQSIITRQIVDERNYAFQMMHEGAVRAPGQKDPIYFENKAKAEYVNRTEFSVHGLEMTPVNLKEFISKLTTDKDYAATVDSQRAKALYSSVEEATRSALLKEDAYKDDAWVLVPKRMIERMNEHQKGVKQVGSIIRKINREFKGSVLAFSPKWHIGNLVDMATRAYFQGVGLQSYVQGARLLREIKKIDPATYNDILSQIMGGHLKSSGDIIKQAEGVDQRVFDQHQIAAVRAAASAVRLGGKGYRKLQEISFGVGGEFEHIARTAGFGKAARLEARRLGYSWTEAIQMQHDVLIDLAENLKTDSSIQSKYGKYVNKVFGDYTTMSPEVRFAMQTYAPFLMWLRASTKWALTLPKESPVRAAMITAVNRLNESERAKIGLSTFSGKSLPEYLLGSIAANPSGSKLYRTQAYTSFGPLTDIEGLAEFALPQFNSLIEAWKGKDWLGEEIVNPDGSPLTDPQRVSILLMKMLETYVAPIGYAHKIVAHGDPSETFSIFDLNQLAEGPAALLHGAQERKHFKKGEYGYTQEEKEEVEEAKPKSNIWEATFAPWYQLENPVIRNRKYEKEASENAFTKKSSKSSAEIVEENLTGSSHTKKAKTDKRRKKSSSVVMNNLFGK